jgi:hypothetical protein
MPTKVICEKANYGGRCRDAAIEICQNGSLTPFKYFFSKRHYIISQFYSRKF